ncbi:MAG TPA: histidine phosphatase family protein [Alphaproteobacteria bacterium]|nr:histidine phosphatase family protein [Alphaproteobacteria bacterium]
MPIALKSFYMIRHGESEANVAGRFSGNSNVNLTQRGRMQAQEAGKIIEALEIKPVSIVHSHLSRAIDTAAIINQSMNLPMYETPLLGEHHFGDWEGAPWDEIRPRFHAGENPPNGETHDDFAERLKSGFNFALEKDGPVLIVCHGGVFRGFNYIYGKTMHGIENCKLYHFRADETAADFPWQIKLIG